MASKLDIAGHANDDSSSSESDGCSCADLTTPLGHETFRCSIDVRELDSENGFVCPFLFLSFFVFYAYL